MGGNAMLWRPQFSPLSQSHRVYAPDPIGEPGKSASVRHSWRGPGYAEWLVDVFDALEVVYTWLFPPHMGAGADETFLEESAE